MYSLNEAQIKHFEEKGWVGPLDTFSLSEIQPVIECLENNSHLIEIDGKPTGLKTYNNIMNVYTPRDHHLFHKPIAEMFKSPKIVQRLNQLGEPNLLLWRSEVFCKFPGQGTVKWHQVREFYWASDINYEKQTLVYPKGEENVLNLTVWVALDDATLENGCLRFANSSHKKLFKILKGALPAEEGLFAALGAHKSVYQAGEKYAGTFDFDENEWEIEAVPAKAGQIIVFTETCMHSSVPNITTDKRRLAISARYIRPSVLIFPHRLKDDFIDQNGHNIQRQFSILVSGRDDYGINVVREWNDLDETEVEFQTMSNLARFGHVDLPKGKQQLEIESLYRQAMEGDCQEEEPDPILEPRKYIQWQAWKQLQGMSCTEAMKRYSQLIAALTRMGVRKEQSQKEEIQAWLVSYIAKLLEVKPDEVDVKVSFERYALESVDAADLTAELEAWLQQKISPTVMYNYPSIEALAEHLASESNVKVNRL